MSTGRSLRTENPSASNYTDWVEIGKGGFGTVYKARKKLVDQVVAIKKLPKKRIGVRVQDEVDAMQQLNNAKGNSMIVKFYETFSDDDSVYIVMEYCEQGSLREYIKKNGPLKLATAAGVLFQLVEGVKLIHKVGIMHRDLTISNILISRVQNDRLFVKIADFGLTKKTQAYATKGTCLGTPGYIAPQVKNRQEYGRQADVYSLGAILFAMFHAADPPSDLSWDSDGCPLFSERITSRMDQRVLELLLQMMCKFEGERITLEEIVNHPFIKLAHDSNIEKMNFVDAPRKARDRPLVDSGRGSGSGSNGRSSSRCRHPNVLPSNRCQDCGFTLSNRRNTANAANTLVPVTHVPMLSSRRSITPSEENSSERNSRPTSAMQSSKSSWSAWPIPDVRYLAYITTNKFGRFSIRPDERPSMVYEMADDNGNVKQIFELYDNSVPKGQRLLVYKPKIHVPIPEKSDRFLDKNFKSEVRLRCEDDVKKANADIRLGYKRLWQFIALAKTRVTQAFLRNAFGSAGFNLELKYSGTIELTLIDGRKASQSPSGQMSVESLNSSERLMFQCGCIKLRQIIDLKPFEEQLSQKDRMRADEFLSRPCVTTWAKIRGS